MKYLLLIVAAIFILYQIGIIAIFFSEKFNDSKTYKFRFNHQLEFNKKELSKIISETWSVKNNQ